MSDDPLVDAQKRAAPYELQRNQMISKQGESLARGIEGAGAGIARGIERKGDREEREQRFDRQMDFREEQFEERNRQWEVTRQTEADRYAYRMKREQAFDQMRIAKHEMDLEERAAEGQRKQLEFQTKNDMFAQSHNRKMMLLQAQNAQLQVELQQMQLEKAQTAQERQDQQRETSYNMRLVRDTALGVLPPAVMKNGTWERLEMTWPPRWVKAKDQAEAARQYGEWKKGVEAYQKARLHAVEGQAAYRHSRATGDDKSKTNPFTMGEGKRAHLYKDATPHSSTGISRAQGDVWKKFPRVTFEEVDARRKTLSPKGRESLKQLVARTRKLYEKTYRVDPDTDQDERAIMGMLLRAQGHNFGTVSNAYLDDQLDRWSEILNIPRVTGQ